MTVYSYNAVTKNDVDYLPGFEKKDLLSYYGFQEKDSRFNTDDSEQSYDPPCAYYSEGNFRFLAFNNVWLSFIGITITLQYATYSYMECYDRSFLRHNIFIVFQVFSMIMNATDILSSTLHYFNDNVSKQRIHKKKHMVILILDLIYLIYIPIQIYIFVKDNETLSKLVLALNIFRLFHPISYFFTITKSPLRQSLKFVLLKYTILLCITIHTVAWVWMLIGCYKCKDDKFRWTDDVEPDSTSFSLYAKCLYVALGSSTSVGLMGAKIQNDAESMLLVIMMYFNLFIMTGVFLGAFAAVQVDKNKRRYLFGTRLNSIQENLKHEKNISISLKKKITTWYYNYWMQESGLTKSELLNVLPESMRKEILLDKYWYALNQSSVLRNCSVGLLRAIADVMSTVSYYTGDIIMHQDKVQNSLLFVAKGIVQIVAPDDIESPIITFGYGTCLGDLSLYLNVPCAAHVLAASYCKIYVLKKKNLWKTLAKYGKLHDNLHDNLNFVLKNARLKQIRKKQILQSTKKVEKTLKKVKRVLQVKFNQFRFDSATSKLFSGEKEAHDLYIISKAESNEHRDKIFLNTTWPWILYPKTQLILIWNTLIFLYSIIVLLMYPYEIFFLEEYPVHFDYFLRPVAYLLFTADIILQIFTAVEDDQQNFNCKLSDIISKRLSQLSFLIDLASILPLELILKEPFGKTGVKYCMCNHLLKIIRVLKYFGDLSSNFKIGTNLIKIIYYIICLGYLGYLQGILYYFVAGCPSRPCPSDSWVNAFKKNLEPDINIKDDKDAEILFVSILYGLLLTSSTGGRAFVTTAAEKIFSAIFIIGSIFLYTYLVADYTSTLTLSQMIRQKFFSNVATARNYMVVMKAKETLIERINIYLETQLNQGVKLRELMFDMPKPFYNIFSRDRYLPLLQSVPLFKIFDSDMIKEISGLCGYDLFPPNEFITYSGSIPRFIYIIEKGYCEIKTSGQDRVEKVLGPLQYFNALEMILEVPALYNVKSITNVSVLKISLADINKVLSKNKDMLHCVSELVNNTKNAFVVKRLFIRSDQALRSLEINEEKSKSFFTFPKGKLHPLNKDYIEGWKGFSLLRIGLLRTMILPNGKFLYYYLVFQAVISFLICIVNTCDFFYECILPKYVVMLITLPLDIVCLLDVYIRMHVCYYNKDGILVTHPKSTARHYFTTSFAIDFITALPIKLMFSFVINRKTLCYMTFIKLLRIYRIPHGFAYWSRDRLKNESILVSVFKYAVMTLVIVNTVATIGVIIGCEYIENKNGTTTLKPLRQSWIYTKQNTESSIDLSDSNPSPLNIYFVAIYYFGCVMMQLGLGDYTSVQYGETIFTIIIIMTGYLWFTYILVIITNTKAIVNDHLTIYQNYMKDMLNFLKIQSIPKVIQNKTIRHFEYLWQRTQGSTTTEILNYFHPTLKEDIILSLYFETLSNVTLFENADITFYNYLGECLVETYYLHNSFIIQVNNIIDSIYIVHRGEVRILGADGKFLVLLKRGGVFGNLDNVECIRSMVAAETSSTADILQIKSQDFYEILKKYPYMRNMLENHLLTKNMFYINTLLGNLEITEDLSQKKNSRIILSNLERFCMSRAMELICMIIAILSYLLILYHAVYQTHNMPLIIITYFLDLLHIIKTYLAFQTPYLNEMGEIISNKKLIKRRCFRHSKFYFDMFALLPLEILSLAFDTKNIWMYIAWFRINRLTRLFNIGSYFSVTDDCLNINVMATKLSANLIYFTLYTHTLACIWYLVGCPNRNCNIHGWTFNQEMNISACNTPYICSLYYTTNIITYTGYPTIIPRSYIDVGMCILSVCVSKFVISIFISNTAAIVRLYGYKLGEYSGKMFVLKTYFVNSNISFLLQMRMLNYLEKLWFRRSSNQTQVFLDMAPTTLSEEIKVFAFGNHIFNNVIFSECHSDFLRLVISKTKMLTFFYDDIICTQGDINDTMFFIHRGRVNVLLVRPFEELIVDVLEAEDCFGMIQGLFLNTPHSHSYQAKALTEVITLRLNDWADLLRFYPASKFLIYSTIRDYNKIFDAK